MIDFKLKLPKGYISFSQMNLYLWDPREYYEQYILGKNFMAELRKTDIDRWDKITLGSIFQEAWADPRINWRRRLKSEGFTANKERIIKTALDQKNLMTMATSKCDKEIRTNFEGIPLIIKPDGFDKEKRILLENKFGAIRSQEKVDEDNQISFYCLGIKLLFGWIPETIILQSVNDRTGKVEPVKTKRTKADLDHVGELIKLAARGISEGVWEK